MFRKNLSVPFSRGNMGPEMLSRKVGSYPSTLCNISEEQKVSVSISYYTGSSDSAIVIDKLARIRKEGLVANFELLNQNFMGQNEENYVNLARIFGITAGIRISSKHTQETLHMSFKVWGGIDIHVDGGSFGY